MPPFGDPIRTRDCSSRRQYGVLLEYFKPNATDLRCRGEARRVRPQPACRCPAFAAAARGIPHSGLSVVLPDQSCPCREASPPCLQSVPPTTRYSTRCFSSNSKNSRKCLLRIIGFERAAANHLNGFETGSGRLSGPKLCPPMRLVEASLRDELRRAHRMSFCRPILLWEVILCPKRLRPPTAAGWRDRCVSSGRASRGRCLRRLGPALKVVDKGFW